MDDDVVKQLLLGFQTQLAALTEQNRALTEVVTRLTAPAAALAPAAPPPPVAAPVPTGADLPLTFTQLWPDYVRSEERKLESWRTVEGRGKHVIRILGARRVMATDLDTIRFYRDVRTGEFTIRKMLTTPATRNREVELIRRLTNWASKAKIIPFDPLRGITREDLFEDEQNVRRNVIEDDPTSSMSLDDLLRHGNELDQAIVLVAHSSGMRRKEIAVLETGWLDLRPGPDHKPLRIVEIPPGISKGRRGKKLGRQTFISEDALAAVKRYEETLPFPLRRRRTWLFVNATQRKDGRPTRYYGKHLHPDTLTSRFKELQERAGMSGPSGPPWLHDLRRSFITLGRRRGEDTLNLMEASGHKTLKAFQRYDIHARKDALVVRDRIDHGRAEELAAIALQTKQAAESRMGPHRAQSATVAPNTSLKKNNPHS